MKNTIKDIVIVLLLSLLAIASFHSCNIENALRDVQEKLVDSNLNNELLYKKIDSQDREVSKVQSIVVEKDKQIQKHLKEISDLKNLDAKVVFRTRTKIDTLRVAVIDTLIIQENDTIYDSRFSFSDKWIAMKGSVERESIVFDSLVINNAYNIELGQSRKGIFGRENVAFIRNENPYTSTTEAKSFVLKENKKWYQKDGFKVAASVVLGIFLGSRL